MPPGRWPARASLNVGDAAGGARGGGHRRRQRQLLDRPAIGPRAFSGEVRFLKKEHLDRTHRFYEKYGGKTIILARFVPIVRTFAPFVAGVGAMNYGRFLLYDVPGGMAWVSIFVVGGYLLGSIPWFKDNFIMVVLAIIIISVLPMVVELVRRGIAPEKDWSAVGLRTAVASAEVPASCHRRRPSTPARYASEVVRFAHSAYLAPFPAVNFPHFSLPNGAVALTGW